MSTSPRYFWIRAALVAGAAYLFIGRVFPAPAGSVRAWRLAAWVASGAVFAAHIAYEYFRLRDSPRVVAWHTALGVAIGGFTLAAAGALRSLSATSTLQPTWILSLVLWPLITAVPAFIAALLVATILSAAGHPEGD